MNKMIRRKELLELIGVSSTTQWRMERAGQFPGRVKLGKASVGWHQTEVESWLEDRERVSERSQGSDGLRPGQGKSATQWAANSPSPWQGAVRGGP